MHKKLSVVAFAIPTLVASYTSSVRAAQDKGAEHTDAPLEIMDYLSKSTTDQEGSPSPEEILKDWHTQTAQQSLARRLGDPHGMRSILYVLQG